MEFIEFPKLARLSREIIVTEKIDGTNAQVHITEDGKITAGSRTRWITPEADNFGFAAWGQENRGHLLELGPGSHFGEWWGAGIQPFESKKFFTGSAFPEALTGAWTEKSTIRAGGSFLRPFCLVIPQRT